MRTVVKNRIFSYSAPAMICAAVWMAAGDAARAQTVDAMPPDLATSCVMIFERGARQAADEAEECAQSMTDAWGAEDPRLIALYTDIAAEISGVPKKAADALPYRERADMLAAQIHGPDSLEAAQTALAYVRTLILAGRCEGLDPAVQARLDRARAGFEAAPESAARTDGLRALAAAYADADFFPQAAETMLVIDEMTARDWGRVGTWRMRNGDEEGAEAALRTGLRIADDRYTEARLRHVLKTMLFERGDFEGLSTLE